MRKQVFVGQRLITTSNEVGKVLRIEGDILDVQGEDEVYRCTNDFMGNQLVVLAEGASEPVPAKEKEEEYIEDCENCMLMKNGSCAGLKGLCEDYRPAPSIPKEVKENYPKDGDASFYRQHPGRRRR